MPTNTGQFSQLLAPGLRKIFFQHLKLKPPQYTKIANLLTSSRAYEEDLELMGLGTMPVKNEGESIIYQDPKQGGKVRTTMVSFGMGFRVTVEMWEDDLYGPMRRMPRELGKAANNVRDVRFFNLLNNGFTAAANTGFTKNNANEPLFSTAHTLLGGGTQANRASTDADLGIASLEAAVLLFDNLVDESGFPVTIEPKVIVISPTLKQIARELLGSEFKPYTSGNEINAVREEGMRAEVVNFLTNANSWYLLAEKGEHDLNFYERTNTQFQNGDDFDTGDAKFKAFQRFQVNYGEYRGTFASQGG
jgi:phage major head subunit gpT-like protein